MTPTAAVPHWAGDDASIFRAIEQLGGDYNNMKVWASGVFIGTKYMWGVNYETPVTDTTNWKTSAAPGKCLKYKVNKKDKNNGYALADCTLYTSLLCQREKNALGNCPTPFTGSAFEVGNMCFKELDTTGVPGDNEYFCNSHVQNDYVPFMSQPLSKEVMDGLSTDVGMPVDVWTPFQRRVTNFTLTLLL
uniref:C-type lectin domain-containing protein n=1 Tax=Clytia hemisphaerica TaxID=252671 RepID=A0A7M5UXI2_9CNID|eukprot:TCONS_00035908-protein